MCLARAGPAEVCFDAAGVVPTKVSGVFSAGVVPTTAVVFLPVLFALMVCANRSQI